MTVTFSVVVPVHDVLAYLVECLDSILGQSFTDLEVIAVDDASTDGCSPLLDEYAAADERLTVLHLAENVGLGHARNAGLELARGRYLLFVDSDDSLADGALAAIADRIADSADRADRADPDLVVFDYVRTFPSGERRADPLSSELLRADPAPFRTESRPRYLDLFPVVWNKAYRREFIAAGGFRFPTGFYEDLPWTYPVLITAERVVTLERVCYLYRQRTGAILRSADRRHLDFFTQFGLVFDFLDAHPELGAWRAPLFDRLTRHGPWILEIGDRVGPDLRREFYAAASESFRRNRPAGFVAPSRSAATKIALIERGDYRAFRAAQLVNVARRRAGDLRRRATPDAQRTALATLLAPLVADAQFGASASATDEAKFHAELARVVTDVDEARIRDYPGIDEQLRQALLVGLKGRPAPPPRIRADRARGLVRIAYYVGAHVPRERVELAGAAVEPRHAKVRAISYLDRVVLRERIAWLPADATLTLDGQVVPLRAGARAAPSGLRARLRRLPRLLREQRHLIRTVTGDLVLRLLARRRAARERYRDAWLLVDRDSEAQDNAEHLYRHLQRARPDINAYFVLSRHSTDWPRLAKDGFRLLEHGSREHYVALQHCTQLASSQVDTYVNQPFWQRFLPAPQWRFTFLQHGVTQNDLSRWINAKPIDLILTATPDEQAGFTADGTPYPYTTLDSQLTGFTRHDRLYELGRDAAQPHSLLVMPTWRQELLGAKAGGNLRDLRADFWSSEFARAWRALLESERVRDLCASAGWTLNFVPHPNLQDYVASSPLPAHVRTLRFRDIDVQQALAEAAVLVTDYSSVAFDAAYLQRPVVYYQFDRETFFAGNHVVRRGTWSYTGQGFGPVVADAADALDALGDVAAGNLDPVYAERAADIFPFRDGRCCERAVAAIEGLRAPVTDAVR